MTSQQDLATRSRRIRILLLDHNSLFRESLARLLADEPDLEIAAKCCSAEEAAGVLASRPVDVALLSAPGESCADFFQRKRALGVRTRVLVVAETLGSTEATQLVRLGADGFFFVDDPPELLAQNIRDLADDHLWPNQRYLQAVVQAVQQEGSAERSGHLSQREQAVLRCVLEGMANKEIATRLNISESSVKAAMQQLFEKTDAHSRSKLVRAALEKYREQLAESQRRL